VHLVSVPIDYTENTRVLVDELSEKLKQVEELVT
jgi:acetolactate synthase-1/2/3 large subunit